MTRRGSGSPLGLWLQQHRMRIPTFALRVGVQPDAVRKWIKGERLPNRANMAKIWRATEGAIGPNEFQHLPRLRWRA